VDGGTPGLFGGLLGAVMAGLDQPAPAAPSSHHLVAPEQLADGSGRALDRVAENADAKTGRESAPAISDAGSDLSVLGMTVPGWPDIPQQSRAANGGAQHRGSGPASGPAVPDPGLRPSVADRPVPRAVFQANSVDYTAATAASLMPVLAGVSPHPAAASGLAAPLSESTTIAGAIPSAQPVQPKSTPVAAAGSGAEIPARALPTPAGTAYPGIEIRDPPTATMSSEADALAAAPAAPAPSLTAAAAGLPSEPAGADLTAPGAERGAAAHRVPSGKPGRSTVGPVQTAPNRAAATSSDMPPATASDTPPASAVPAMQAAAAAASLMPGLAGAIPGTAASGAPAPAAELNSTAAAPFFAPPFQPIGGSLAAAGSTPQLSQVGSDTAAAPGATAVAGSDLLRFSVPIGAGRRSVAAEPAGRAAAATAVSGPLVRAVFVPGVRGSQPTAVSSVATTTSEPVAATMPDEPASAVANGVQIREHGSGPSVEAPASAPGAPPAAAANGQIADPVPASPRDPQLVSDPIGGAKPSAAAASVLLSEPGFGSLQSSGREQGDPRSGPPGDAAAAATPVGEPAALAPLVPHIATADAIAPPVPASPTGASLTPAAAQLQTAIHQGIAGNADRIDIHLQPALLGAIEVRLNLRDDGSVAAEVKADRPETLQLLTADAPQLEQSLRDSGLRAEAGCLSFSLRSDGDQPQDRASRGGGGRSARSSRVAGVAAAAASALVGGAVRGAATGSIDIRI